MELTAAIAMLRGDDDGAKARAAYALWNLMQDSSGGLDRTYLDNKVAIREAGCIPLLVALLERDPHPFYMRALETLAWNQAENKVAILESGVVPMLVALVKSGDSGEKEDAAGMLASLSHDNELCCFAIRDADGIPRLVALVKSNVRSRFPHCQYAFARARFQALKALRSLCANNAADMVAIALDLGGFEAIVELARRGGVTVGTGSVCPRCFYDVLGHDGRGTTRSFDLLAPDSKRKAALVVAALLRDCVPGFKLAPRDIKMAIGSFL